MATVTIKNVKITARTIDIELMVYDDGGRPLHEAAIKDSLETDGTHTEAQIQAFVKRKAIVLLQQTARREAIVENIIKKLPEKIEITADDLAKTDPMTIPAAAAEIKTK